MEISTEQLRALFPEITDDLIHEKLAAQAAAAERNARIAEADRLVQSLSDQLSAAQQARRELDHAEG